jgi:ribosome biogenesis GTPase / thiamine phosphate phosphatase
MSNLKRIGYNDNIEKIIDQKMLKKYQVSRVVTVHKNGYIITDGEITISARLSGSLVYKSESSTQIPTTGDWVYIKFYDDKSFAVINGLIERKSILKRKSIGDKSTVQLIGANIDVAFIVQSVDFNLNIKRLERYLVMVNEAKIKAVILLSKCDLASIDEVKQIKENILKVIPNAEIISFSNLDKSNVQIIESSLIAGQTYCLIGSSGVGKTSLLNNILQEKEHKTKIVSKKENKGQHTTTNRELILLENGAIIIDTPGMRELGSISIDDGLDETFTEIANLPNNCKFANCTHKHEKNCAILQAIAEGVVTQDRYNNYIKIKEEAEFNEMPKYERKRRNKGLAKQVRASKNRR